MKAWLLPLRQFQSYLTGIEIQMQKLDTKDEDCSNRTLLELKFARVSPKDLLALCSNRTLLELKFFI